MITVQEREELEQLRAERPHLLNELQEVRDENQRLKRHAEILANRIDHWTRVGKV